MALLRQGIAEKLAAGEWRADRATAGGRGAGAGGGGASCPRF